MRAASGWPSRCALACCGSARRASARQQPFQRQRRPGQLRSCVTDREGNTDHRPDSRDDFEVLEDGKTADDRLLRERRRLDAGAATASRPAARHQRQHGATTSRSRATAAIKFLNTLTRRDDMTLVDFDTEVRVARYAPASYRAARSSGSATRKADGWTALYDAIGVYLDGAGAQDGQQDAAVYTDGGDTRQRVDALETLLDLLKASDVTVYAIGYLEHQSVSARQVRSRPCCAASPRPPAGEAFFPHDRQGARRVYDKIRAEIRAQYTLGYMSTDTPRRTARWRKVEIKLKRPDVAPGDERSGRAAGSSSGLTSLAPSAFARTPPGGRP